MSQKPTVVFGMHHFFAFKIQRISVGFKGMKLVFSRVTAFGGSVFCSCCLGILKNFVIDCMPASEAQWYSGNEAMICVLALKGSWPPSSSSLYIELWIWSSSDSECLYLPRVLQIENEIIKGWGKLLLCSLNKFIFPLRTRSYKPYLLKIIFVGIKIFMWGWNLPQTIKCFLYKHEDLSLKPQGTHKKLCLVP